MKRPPVPARRPAPLRRSDIPAAAPARRASGAGSVLSAILDHGPVARSTFEPSAIVEGQWTAERRGRERVVAEQPASSRAERQAARFDITAPGNAAKLAAADGLAVLAEEAGLTLVRLALAFVLEHLAVTSAIIGPHTFAQLERRLGADKVRLSRDVLDRIDEIVPPGVNLSARDAGYTPAVLTDASLRRRSA
ncbi:aldo/keto reductase [Streptomyces griseus]|uniref:aldo/keto reductase n=1 Tax=Streptomyces griseus TaxID=1911 RepID=UPI0037A3F4B0